MTFQGRLVQGFQTDMYKRSRHSLMPQLLATLCEP